MRNKRGHALGSLSVMEIMGDRVGMADGIVDLESRFKIQKGLVQNPIYQSQVRNS